ncbi:keratin, type I cytoskeletal 9-like isoform X3 [Daphnia pulicaria]|uniref:keratin, type I cytoskeletal 9-like isoform X3 n=1 Tax=Daphnia pulicaria TaxID=35523 RepID=UPI001EECE5A5|nr:keratin, type I cytoskeletal 9-like isoform X3 [Daphnia pulicaria]
MKSSKLNVLIFVTYLVIVSIVSAQEVDDKDLELSETKFKKYYIQRHDSGHGGCDDGHEEVVKVKGKGSSYNVGGNDEGIKGGKGKASGGGYSRGGGKSSGSGSGEQSTSAKGHTVSHGKAKGKGHGGGYSSGSNKGEKGGYEVVIRKVKVKKVKIKGGHHGHRIGSGSDGGGSDEDSNNGRNGYARVRVKGKGKKGGHGYSIGYDSGAGKGSGSVKVKGVTKGKGTTSGYSSKSGSSGSGSGEEGSGGGEKNGNKGKVKRSVSVPSGQAYRVDGNVVNISISTIFTSHRKPNVGPRPVVDGSKNSNKNSRREAPSGKSSVRVGNQSTNGKVVIRSVPVVASVTKKSNTTSSGVGPEKERSSNGIRHIGTVIGNKGNSTTSNGSLILRSGGSASNEKGHNDNGRRSIGTAIGGRSNSSPSSGGSGERGNGRRNVGSVIGDKGNNSSSNGNKAQTVEHRIAKGTMEETRKETLDLLLAKETTRIMEEKLQV